MGSNESSRRPPTWARAAVYLGVAIATSASVGPAATSLSDAWSTVEPSGAAFSGLVWFGPAGVVLTFAPVSRVALSGLAAVLALAAATTWITFATDDSSTSGLVFLWAWIAGVPVAAVVVAVARRLRA
jgi:hypothetical protein